MYKCKARLVFRATALCCLALLMALVVVDALGETAIVTARGGLNVRREPNIHSQKVYTLEETDIVIILEWQDGWAHVANNYPPFLPIGWACGDYLK